MANAWNDGDGKSIAVSSSSAISPPVDPIRKRPDTVGETYLVAVGSRTARFRRKQQERLLIILLVILIILLLIVLIVISCYYAADRKRELCETRQCIRSASNLILSMDQTVNPCEDFYQYACGNWAEEHAKPDFLSSYDWFTDKRRKVERTVRDILSKNTSVASALPLNQAKEMYSACVDTKTLDCLGVQPVIDFLTGVGLPHFPTFLNISKDSKNSSRFTFDWLRSIIKIKKGLGLDVLIGFDIFPDPKNNTNRRLAMGEPSGSEPFPSYAELDKILPKIKKKILFPKSIVDDTEVDEIEEEDEDTFYRKQYKILYTGVLKEFIKTVNAETLCEMTNEELENNINNVLKEHIKFSKIIYAIGEELKSAAENTTSENDDSYETFDYSVKRLQNETNIYLTMANCSNITIWAPYLLGLFNGTSVKLDFEKDAIMFSEYDLNYLFALAAIIQGTSPLTLELYVWFQVVDNFIPHTTTAIREMYDKYMRAITGLESNIPRSIRCASSVSVMMGMAVGYAVADKSFMNTTLPKVSKMLENIKSSFEDLITSISWMDRPTKAASIEKVRSMKSLIGFPPWLLVPGKLEEYYSGVVTNSTKHIENQLSLIQVAFCNKLNHFRDPYAFNWETEPTEVNAYHTFQANAITLNYGSIGAVLGHELTHGFDNLGRHYDKQGTFVQWWSNKTIESYINKTKCFVKQYSNFYLPEIDEYVNGNQTLGENIADNGGVRSALKGYLKETNKDKALPGLTSFSAEQLFFLAYGNLWCGIRTPKSLNYEVKDEHSPSHLRIKGVLQNFPEFAKAWNCPTNTSMNPSKQKCIIF